MTEFTNAPEETFSQKLYRRNFFQALLCNSEIFKVCSILWNHTFLCFFMRLVDSCIQSDLSVHTIPGNRIHHLGVLCTILWTTVLCICFTDSVSVRKSASTQSCVLTAYTRVHMLWQACCFDEFLCSVSTYFFNSLIPFIYSISPPSHTLARWRASSEQKKR